MTPYFCKYYKFDSHFFDALEKGSLHFSEPSQLDDIFDCRFEAKIPENPQKVQERFEKLLGAGRDAKFNSRFNSRWPNMLRPGFLSRPNRSPTS